MQRQLRLGDILDDYCPRERRVTNHAIVAMLGADVKQTRCTTCDAEHEYKQAKIPRQRRKSETTAALYTAVLAGGPKVVTHNAEAPKPDPADEQPIAEIASEPERVVEAGETHETNAPAAVDPAQMQVEDVSGRDNDDVDDDRDDERTEDEEGPVHRPLIRASLPRHEGQPPPQRQAPDFTIRQPGGGRPGRFRSRHQRGGAPFPSPGNRANGSGNGNTAGGPPRGGMPRHGGGRPPQGAGGALPRMARRHGSGRNKRSK
jgi:hypothetical protein